MRDILSKMINLELGILSVTREKIMGFVDELIRAGEVSQDEGRKMVDEYIARGEKSRQELRSEIGRMIRENAGGDLVTRKEFDELKQEMESLKRAVRLEEIEHTFVEKKEV